MNLNELYPKAFLAFSETGTRALFYYLELWGFGDLPGAVKTLGSGVQRRWPIKIEHEID